MKQQIIRVSLVAAFLLSADVTFAKKLTFAEDCSGAAATAITLKQGQSASGNGTTVGKGNDFESGGGWLCGDTGPGVSPDLVARVDVMQDGVLDAHLIANGFHPALYLRSVCATDGLCYELPVGQAHAREHLAAGTYFLVVDGKDSTGGQFGLDVSLSAPVCGDGAISPGETCDDGNVKGGDGCSPACLDEPPGFGDTCPGTSIVIGPGQTIFNGWTYGYSDEYASIPYWQGGCGFASGGRDRVYSVMPTVSGTMTVTTGVLDDGFTSACVDPMAPMCWDVAIYARTSCASQSTEIVCSDDGAFDPETISMSVTAGVPIFLFVDGYGSDPWSKGFFNVVIEL